MFAVAREEEEKEVMFSVAREEEEEEEECGQMRKGEMMNVHSPAILFFFIFRVGCVCVC